MPSVVVTDYGYNYISVNCTGLDPAYTSSHPRTANYTLSGGGITRTGSASIPNAVTEGGDYTFRGLSSSTTYTISCTIYVDGYGDVSAGSTSQTTDLPPATPASFYVVVGSVTSNSVKINITKGDSTQIVVYCRTGAVSADGTTVWNESYTGTALANLTNPYEITGLSPSTIYTVNVRYYNRDGNAWCGGKEFTTLSFSTFDWDYAGLSSSGTAVSGSTKQSGLGVYVTRTEWNRLVDCVNDACNTNIPHVTAANTKISATIVNRVANALGVTAVSAGDTISASFFNSLRTAYNNLIS